MSKIELNTSISDGGFSQINANFQLIEDELNQKVLYRANPVGEPNSMNNTDLDMNGKKIFNLPAPSSASEAARLQDVQNAIGNQATANLTAFTPYLDITSNNVQGAVQEAKDDIEAHIADTTNAHASSAIDYLSAGNVTRTVRDKFRDLISVKDFGAKGDGVTDDTAAINAALAFVNNQFTTLVFPPGTYNATTLTLTGLNYNLQFDNAILYGVATSVVDAFVTMSDFATHRILGTMVLQTDGNAVTPVFHNNYTCGLRLVSTAGPNPTQWIYIDHLRINYFRQGVVNGTYVGQAPQPSATQSEIWINDYVVRGVNRPFFGNAINSYITFTNSSFVPQQFEASASWWVDADGWCLRNDDGRSEVQCIGCEFQRAITTGFALYGLGITVVDPVWEVSCPSLVAGDMTLKGGIDNFFGVAAVEPFQVSTTATGKLLLQNFDLERPAGTADFDRTRLINAAGNNNIRIKIHGSRFKEWAFDVPNGNGDFVHGGRLTMSDVFIDNSTGTHQSFELNPGGNVLIGIDRTGNSFPGAGVTTPQGGWTVIAGAANGAYAQTTSNLAPGASAWLTSVTNATGGFTFQTTNAFNVRGSKDYLVDMWLRIDAFTASSTWQCVVEWYDFAGAVILTEQVAILDNTTLTDWNLKTLRYRAPAFAPSHAVTAKLRFVVGPSLTVSINDVVMV